MGKSKAYSQMGIEERRVIEAVLDAGGTLAEAASRIGRDPASVSREVARNAREDGPSQAYRRDKNDCALLYTCKVKGACARDCGRNRLCRCCPQPCHEGCGLYAPRGGCPGLDRAPHVCNACRRYPVCTMQRRWYSADAADSLADSRRAAASSGVRMSEAELAYLEQTVRAGLAKGQSVHHIFQTNRMPCSERTFYRLVEDGRIGILPLDLPKKVKYRPRGKAPLRPKPKSIFEGRTYDDFMELDPDDRARATQVDTVYGAQGESKCILSLHRVDLRFQPYLLLPRRTKEEVVSALDWLERACDLEGPGGEVVGNCFEELFGLMLIDRGGEFEDPEGMERSARDPEKKRCCVYYTDPQRPDQKGGCEKNHVELRKVLPKGTSLERMSTWVLSDICSHVNSTVRKGCGEATPLALARAVFPQSLLDALGIRLIPPQDVVSAPGILYAP